MSFEKKKWLVLYYIFARYLPGSNTLFGKICFAKQIRYLCCKHIFKKIGRNVNIEKGAWFGRGYEIEIGDNSGIGYNAHILYNTKIGNDVMMGRNFHILESVHNHSKTDIPMRLQGRNTERSQVVICDDVWIGNDVLVLGSRKIESGSIVAARTVLVKSFPKYSMIGGNPSILIKSRISNV